MATRLQIAKNDIVNLFENSFQRIWKYSEIGRILEENREFWRLAKSTTLAGFIGYLIDNTKFKEVKLKFPSRPETRYVWDDISIFEILVGLNKKAYFSHYTAMLLNDLTDQIPKTIYLNVEQPQRGRSSNENLLQSNIDRAFANKHRITNNYTIYKNSRIYFLNGKQSNNLGVVEIEDSNKALLRVTNIERTLIDIVVRPAYSGGVYEVLGAYKKAKGRVSVNKLMSYLSKLNFIYPYHQAIGFYLEKAGYKENQIALAEQIEMRVNFYLDYQMQNPSYSSRWKLYHPKGM
jgi:predicted transcriptional regulator of viral defense system